MVWICLEWNLHQNAGVLDNAQMNPLFIRSFHQQRHARLGGVNGGEVVLDYGNPEGEQDWLRKSAGVMDMGFRTRICLVGADRARFLHGQVTNHVNRLREGEGIRAAITTPKGRLEADLNILCLKEELLLDAEPGLAAKLTARLEKYVVADDVQVVDAAPAYGLLTVQGPRSEAVLAGLGWLEFAPNPPGQPPVRLLESVHIPHPDLGEIYVAANPRLGRHLERGYDFYIPNPALERAAESLLEMVHRAGGGLTGWNAWETLRIEAGVPRFGVDMDEQCLPMECGLEPFSVAYDKGCYIGQEVLNRLHTQGRVTRALRGLRFLGSPRDMPQLHDKLVHQDREIGHVTSAVLSPVLGAVGMGYVRREFFQPGNRLEVLTRQGRCDVEVFDLPAA